MLLAIDIGNTQIVLGLIDRTQSAEHRMRFCWRLGTVHQRTQDEWSTLIFSLFQQHGLNFSVISGVAICCVVPPLQRPFAQLTRELFKCAPVVIEPGIKTGMPILYDNPKEVGADRIVNAVAAFKRYHSACIVVDFGTANTFDFVTTDGKYAGGIIAPGLEISADALFQRAAKLPRVDVVAPDRVIGKNTVSSIQAGLFYGCLGSIDRIVAEILQEARLERSQVRVVATGGLAQLVGDRSPAIDAVLPHLTLEGLEIIYHLNCSE